MSTKRAHQKLMVDIIEGNHDRLPLSMTFLNRSSSREQATPSKEGDSRLLADGNAPAGRTSC
jgi:hypothetical protein